MKRRYQIAWYMTNGPAKQITGDVKYSISVPRTDPGCQKTNIAGTYVLLRILYHRFAQ